MSEKKHENRYGLLSMISIIVGTVIGSGIYVKNSSLMADTGSAILSMIGWVLGGLIVLAILIAIIEIASITKQKNEQGTLNSWAKYFWGPKMSRLFTSYFVFIYFPLIIASESVFSITQLMQTTTFASQSNAFALSTILALLMIFMVFMITSFTVRPGKAVTSVGSIVKIIPLILIISVMFLVLFGVTIGDKESINGVFDPNSQINNGLSTNPFSHVLLILPAILFAFDGFLYSATLTSEAKKPSTFKIAAIISILFITLIYIIFSLSTYALAPSDALGDSNSYTISSVLTSIWPNASWLITSVNVIISFSILTAVFGYAIISMWSLADASNTNEIVDKDGELIRRYKSGNPSRSSLWVLLLAIVALAFMRGFDLIAILATDSAENSVAAVGDPGMQYIYYGMTDYISNLFSVINFTFYIILILGGIKNRFTKKVDVEKEKLFWPSAIIAIIGVSIVVVSMICGIGKDLISGFKDGQKDSIITASLQGLSIVILIAMIIFNYIFITIKKSKQDDDVWKNKNKYQHAYKEHLTMKEFVEKYN